MTTTMRWNRLVAIGILGFSLGFPSRVQGQNAAASPYWIAYQCGTEICIQSETGQTITLTKSQNDTNAHPVWSRDATRIYFARTSRNYTATIEGATGGQTAEIKNVDIYERDLTEPGVTYFAGDSVTVSKPGAVLLTSGFERPLRPAPYGTLLILGDFLPSPSSTGTVEPLRLARLRDPGSSQTEYSGRCLVDPTYPDQPDILDPQYLTVSPNGQTMASVSKYLVTNTSGGMTAFTNKFGVTRCTLDGQSGVRLVDARTDLRILDDTVLSYDGSLAITDAGSLYHLSSRARASIERMNGGPLAGTGTLRGQPFFLSPDRKKIAVDSASVGLYLVDAATGVVKDLPGDGQILGWSADGKRVLLATYTSLGERNPIDGVTFVNPATKESRVVTLPDGIDQVLISPAPIEPASILAATEPDPDMPVPEVTPTPPTTPSGGSSRKPSVEAVGEGGCSLIFYPQPFRH